MWWKFDTDSTDQQALLLNHKRKKENKRIFTKAKKLDTGIYLNLLV